MPSPYLLVAVQSTMGLVVVGLLARHYVLPWLERQDFHAALAPVLLLHGLRFLGLSLLAPDQAAAGQDRDALTSIASGDLVLVGVLVNANGIVEQGMGFMWATLGLLAPALVLSHVHVLRAPFGRRATADVATARAA